ncbi:MAG: MarR family transcriptional regulator [Candidatus Bathyarchaeia archaeon]
MVASRWEILELLRRFDKLTTSEIASSLNIWADDVSRPIRQLESWGLVRRTGVIRRGRRGQKTIEWELTGAAKNRLKKGNYRTFYDIPACKESEKKRIENFGRGYKRFY